MAKRKPMEVQIIRAKDVAIPMVVEPTSPQLLKLRAEFLSGKKLSPERMRTLIRSSESGSGGNGNCNLC